MCTRIPRWLLTRVTMPISMSLLMEALVELPMLPALYQITLQPDNKAALEHSWLQSMRQRSKRQRPKTMRQAVDFKEVCRYIFSSLEF